MIAISPLSWSGLGSPCTDSAQIQSKCTSSSMSVLSLQRSILQTHTDTHKNGHPGYNSKHLYTKNMLFSVLLNPIWWHGAWTVVFRIPPVPLRAGPLPKSAQGETWNIWMRAGRHFSAVTLLHFPPGAIAAAHFHSWITKAVKKKVDDYYYPRWCLLFLMRGR